MDKFIRQFSRMLCMPYTSTIQDKHVSHFDSIIILGMGGSGIVGDLLKLLVDIPVFVVKTYSLPNFLKKYSHNALCFIISYSGNTEETLSLCKETSSFTSRIIITSNLYSQLGQYAQSHSIPYIKIQEGYPPRSALPLIFAPIYKIICKDDMSALQDYIYQLYDIVDEEVTDNFAHKIYNRIPILYTCSTFECVALRWQCQFNENSKVIAHHNVFPECCHNEIVGYQYDTSPFVFIFIEDVSYDPKILQRMHIVKNMLPENRVITLRSPDDQILLHRLFYLIFFGDLLSVALADVNKVDSFSVQNIDSLKSALHCEYA